MLFPQRLKTQECRDTNLWHLVERTVLPLPTVRNFFSPKFSCNQIGLYSYRWVSTDWQLFYLASAFLLSFKFSTFAKKLRKKATEILFERKKKKIQFRNRQGFWEIGLFDADGRILPRKVAFFVSMLSILRDYAVKVVWALSRLGILAPALWRWKVRVTN